MADVFYLIFMKPRVVRRLESSPTTAYLDRKRPSHRLVGVKNTSIPYLNLVGGFMFRKKYEEPYTVHTSRVLYLLLINETSYLLSNKETLVARDTLVGASPGLCPPDV